MPDSATVILASGTPGPKRTIAVLGDGWAQGDQPAYDETVDRLLVRGVFAHDCFGEDAAAFRVVRVNLVSAESGVSQRVYDEHGTPDDDSDDTIVSTVFKDTALGYVYNGSWAHCWLEDGVESWTRANAALERWVPEYDLVVVILNEKRMGGCGGGGWQKTTRGSSWQVMAHEFGHGTGGLADEYCRPGAYSGGEPVAVNTTTNADRTTLKWRRFVSPSTPVPTGRNTHPGTGACTEWTEGRRPAAWSSWADVGLFEGAEYRDTGVYRPVEACRMRSNDPPYCPVCYTEIKTRFDPLTGRSFASMVLADVNGDGRDDLVVHNEGSLAVFTSLGGTPTTSNGFEFGGHAVGMAGVWPTGRHDVLLAADVDGDGRDELLLRTGEEASVPQLAILRADANGVLTASVRYRRDLPGWRMAPHDQWFAADTDGDGRAELVVFNASDWAKPYLAVFRSSGGSLTRVVRYDGAMPGWTMRPSDRLAFGDFTDDRRADLLVFNGTDWAVPYLAVMASSGAGFSRRVRYEKQLTGWTMRPHDRYVVADLDGDGRADVYVVNTQDWAIGYLGMLRSDATGLQCVTRYDGVLPGWHLRPGDRFLAGHTGADARCGLLVRNVTDWAVPYLGSIVSTGVALTCARAEGMVGTWRLSSEDDVLVADTSGVGRQTGFVIHTADAVGVGHLSPRPVLDRHYRRWIHEYRYGCNW